MRERPQPAGQRSKGPAPSHAGASLLVHDLKSLAGRLSSLSQNLSSHYDDPLFKQSTLALLDDTVQHLRRLAGDVRDHQERILVKLRTDLSQVASDAVSDARPDLAPQIKTVENYAELPLIWADTYLLRRAFACAIENAIEAMQGKAGTLGVRTVARSGEILVEISDTGEGMDSRFIREALFRPFASTKDDGLGLGAYTMRQVAKFHGGSIRIRSSKRSGTRVSFLFPAEDR